MRGGNKLRHKIETANPDMPKPRLERIVRDIVREIDITANGHDAYADLQALINYIDYLQEHSDVRS